MIAAVFPDEQDWVEEVREADWVGWLQGEVMKRAAGEARVTIRSAFLETGSGTRSRHTVRYWSVEVRTVASAAPAMAWLGLGVERGPPTAVGMVRRGQQQLRVHRMGPNEKAAVMRRVRMGLVNRLTRCAKGNRVVCCLSVFPSGWTLEKLAKTIGQPLVSLSGAALTRSSPAWGVRAIEV